MSQTFGERLRQQREDRGIDLIAIAEQTKIKRSLLEALEHDDVSQWPSGIFRRAFIRAYAVAIGLDPDAVVREFLEVHPEPVDVVAEAVAALSGADEGWRKSTGPPIRLRYMMGSALSSLSRLRRGPTVETAVPATTTTTSNVVTGIAPDALASAPEHEGVVECGAMDAPPVTRRVDEPPVIGLVDEPPVIDEPPAIPTAPLPSSGSLATPTVLAVPAPLYQGPELAAIADLVTQIGRIEAGPDAEPLLKDAAEMLDAAGVVLWAWDDALAQLLPTFVYGYSARVLAQLPAVHREADNATAAAFRAARTCEVAGAIVVPLLTTAGCCGVLAIELRERTEPTKSIRATATILAAAFAQLVQRARAEEQQPQVEPLVPAVVRFGQPTRPMKVRR